MARATQTYTLTNVWIPLNPNGEETVIIQGVTSGNIRLALGEDPADFNRNDTDPDNIIEAEEGHALNRDTGMGTAFYNLTKTLYAKRDGTAIPDPRGKSLITVTAY